MKSFRLCRTIDYSLSIVCKACPCPRSPASSSPSSSSPFDALNEIRIHSRVDFVASLFSLPPSFPPLSSRRYHEHEQL